MRAFSTIAFLLFLGVSLAACAASVPPLPTPPTAVSGTPVPIFTAQASTNLQTTNTPVNDSSGLAVAVSGVIISTPIPSDSATATTPTALPPSATPTVVPSPSPVPAPPTRIRLGGNVERSKLISGPRPVYPPLARQARISGTVLLDAVISREGAILNLRAVSGHPLLIPAAVAAVRQWVFRPTLLNGDPVEVATEIEVNFTLRQ